MTVARQVFEDSGKIHAYVQAISSVLSQVRFSVLHKHRALK